jgi:uncharacterized Fe-S cluster-containing MiaB family protein
MLHIFYSTFLDLKSILEDVRETIGTCLHEDINIHDNSTVEEIVLPSLNNQKKKNLLNLFNSIENSHGYELANGIEGIEDDREIYLGINRVMDDDYHYHHYHYYHYHHYHHYLHHYHYHHYHHHYHHHHDHYHHYYYHHNHVSL